MSTLRVNAIQNTTTTDGGISIDNSGHVSIEGQRLPSDGPLSNRNLVINGAMQVAQRGTSETGVGNDDSGYHTVDRMRFTELGAPTCEFTISQSTTAPEGFSHSYRLDTTTAQASIADADAVYIDYRIEAYDCQRLVYGTNDAKSITVSFYVRTTVAGTYALWLYNQDGNAALTRTYTISSDDTGTWQYRTFTVAGDTANAIDNNNGTGLFVRFVLCAGTDFTSGTASATWAADSVTAANRYVGHTANVANSTDDDWAITGLQVEVGDVATPFEHRSFGDELTRCCRYYQKSYNYADAPGTATNNGSVGSRSDQNTGVTHHPGTAWRHTMRANPTVTLYSPEDGNTPRVSDRASSLTTHTNNGTVSSIFGAGQNGFTSMVLSAAEGPCITYHYTAEAEL